MSNIYSIQNSKSVAKSTVLDETISCASRRLILGQRTQNLEFINFKCATYKQHIRVPLIIFQSLDVVCTHPISIAYGSRKCKSLAYGTNRLVYENSLDDV